MKMDLIKITQSNEASDKSKKKTFLIIGKDLGLRPSTFLNKQAKCRRLPKVG